MGLITGLLTLPLAPVRGAGWVAEKVAEEADQEMYDENRIMRQLADLEAAHDQGEIGQTEFDTGVDQLLERLEIARQRQAEQRAGGVELNGQ